MVTDWVQLANGVRSHYVERYRDWVAGMADKAGRGGPEVALQLSENAKVARQLYRVDYMANAEGKSKVVEFQFDQFLDFERTESSVESTALTLSPFNWERAIVTLEGAVWPKEPLLDWFDDWFGLTSGREDQAEPGQLGGLIHSLSIAEARIEVDLGSAPVEAFEQLLKLAASTTASRIIVATEFTGAGEEQA